MHRILYQYSHYNFMLQCVDTSENSFSLYHLYEYDGFHIFLDIHYQSKFQI
jgi:hypothetical protein